MSAIKLHVGYVGKTREGKRVEIVPSRVMTTSYKGSNGFYYRDDGACLHVGPQEIIGPWVDAPAAPAPDYNNGEWWGWNGGECPVHPETMVIGIDECGARWTSRANCNDWPSFHGAFRVVTPYVEPPKPPKPRECWMAERDGKMIEVHCHVSDAIHFREVLK